MGLLKLLGIKNQPDAALVQENNTLKEENAKLKQDNLNLMGRYSTEQKACVDRGRQLDKVEAERDAAKAEVTKLVKENDELSDRVEELESDEKGTKVTYASARKIMTKAKLKDLRAQLEAVPRGANGFHASVSVYDKRTKRLKVVELKSKEEALELVGRAEKGNVEIVI